MSATMTQTDIEDPEHLGKQPQPRAASGAIVVQNKPFADALARAASIAGRSDIPIVSCVLLRSDGHLLTIEANNLELAIRQTITVSGGSGEGCVNAAMLNAIMQRLPQGAETALEFRGDRMAWKCGTSRGTLEALPVAEFPTFTEGEFDCRFTMDGATLLKAFERALPFVSTSEVRYYLQGVHLHVSDVDGEASLMAEATDMQRLTRCRIPCPASAEAMRPVIIPTRSVLEISKMLKGAESVDISTSATTLRVKVADTVLATKLIDAAFPEVERGIPRQNTNELRINAAAFLRALTLCDTAFSSDYRPIKLTITRDGMVVASKNDTNDIRVEMTRGDFEYDGDDIEIGFTVRYLVDTVKLAKETMIFRFRDAVTPYLAWDEADPSAIYGAGSLRI